MYGREQLRLRENEMKIIKLKPNGVGRYDSVSPFIVTDNRLELQVELPNFNGEFYLVYEVNGKTDKRLLPRSGQIILENLSAGELNAEVKHYIKGELIKVYKVEPLLLKEVDGTIAALPEIEELHRHICAVERDFEEFKQVAEKKQMERDKAISKWQKTVETNLLALVRFALKDYQNNVYLNGGTLQDFVKEFDFELTKEQIESLKGEKEHEEN